MPINEQTLFLGLAACVVACVCGNFGDDVSPRMNAVGGSRRKRGGGRKNYLARALREREDHFVNDFDFIPSDSFSSDFMSRSGTLASGVDSQLLGEPSSAGIFVPRMGPGSVRGSVLEPPDVIRKNGDSFPQGFKPISIALGRSGIDTAVTKNQSYDPRGEVCSRKTLAPGYGPASVDPSLVSDPWRQRLTTCSTIGIQDTLPPAMARSEGRGLFRA